MGEQRVSPKKGLSHIPAGVGLKYEGINLNNKDYIKREAKLSTLITHLDQDRIVFIHSPPFTGKTSLCQLLELRLKTEKPDAYTRRLSWIWSEDDEYEALWKKYTEHTFNEWIDISQNDHVYLILDECQAIYSPNSVHFKFWSRLKSVVSPNIHILVVSAYGQVLSSEGRAPISLIESARAKLDYSFMFFDEQEYRQLVNLFCQTSINLSNDVEHLIWLYSGGHIGLIVKTLTKMQEKFTPSGGNSTVPKDTQIMEYLYSSEYSVDIVETRSTPLKYNLDEKKLRIMDSIAHSELYHSSKITVDEDVDWLIRRGYLVRDHRHPDYLRFSSPLYNRYWTLQRLANNQQLLGYLPQPQ